MIHEEGGWPRDIDASEPEQKLRYMCAPRADGGLARASGAAANAAGCCAGRATADSPFFFSPVAPAQQKGREGRGLREVHASTGRRDRALDAAELRDRESLRRVVTLRSVAIPIATCLIHPARAQGLPARRQRQAVDLRAPVHQPEPRPWRRRRRQLPAAR